MCEAIYHLNQQPNHLRYLLPNSIMFYRIFDLALQFVLFYFANGKWHHFNFECIRCHLCCWEKRFHQQQSLVNSLCAHRRHGAQFPFRKLVRLFHVPGTGQDRSVDADDGLHRPARRRNHRPRPALLFTRRKSLLDFVFFFCLPQFWWNVEKKTRFVFFYDTDQISIKPGRLEWDY